MSPVKRVVGAICWRAGYLVYRGAQRKITNREHTSEIAWRQSVALCGPGERDFCRRQHCAGLSTIGAEAAAYHGWGRQYDQFLDDAALYSARLSCPCGLPHPVPAHYFADPTAAREPACYRELLSPPAQYCAERCAQYHQAISGKASRVQ